MDRLLISGAFFLLILEICALFAGLDETTFSGIQKSRREKRIGEVTRTENHVRRRSRSRLVWDESRSGDDVFAYDSVLTLSGSAAQIRLKGETKVHLDENTLVVLEPPAQSEATGLRVRFSRGSLRSTSDRLLAIESEVFTVATDQGTELSLVTLEDGRLSLELEKGRAKLLKPGATEEVRSGEKLILRGDQIESRKTLARDLHWRDSVPRRLYSRSFPVSVHLAWGGDPERIRIIDSQRSEKALEVAGRNDQVIPLNEGVSLLSLQRKDAESSTLVVQARPAPPMRYLAPLPRDRVRSTEKVTFAWEIVPEASQYRLEVSRNLMFLGEMKTYTSERPVVEASLSEGEYYWRVIAIDADRFEIPAPHAYPLYVTPQPLESPHLKAPAIRELPRDRSPANTDEASLFWRLLLPRAVARAPDRLEASFSWSAVDGADHYVIEIASTPGFENPVVNLKTKTPNFTWRSFARGTYYWRVAAGAEGRLGLFSSPASADLSKENRFAGDGVVVRAKALHPTKTERLPQAPPVELGVDTSERDLKPAPEPKPLPPARIEPPAPPEETEIVRTSGFSGRAILRPQYRMLNLTSPEETETEFRGWVPLSGELEIDFLSGGNHLWEWRLGYDRASWKPKNSPYQSMLTDQRIQTDLFYRPGLGRWAYGVGAETLPFASRLSADDVEIKSSLLLGPSIRYSRTLEGNRELDLQLRLRADHSKIGARFTGGLKFFILERKNYLLFLGPTASYGYASGDGRTFSETQCGIDLGIGW